MPAYTVRQVFTSKEFQYVLEIDFQIESFREYIKLTEEVIDIDIKSKIESYNKFLEEASEIEIEYMHDFQDHEIKINTRQLYYSSLFISLYSFLEKKMYQLCRLAENNQSLKVKDLSDEGIFKYYKYFVKVLNINLDELNVEWEQITKYNKLRNRLVHFPTNIIEKADNSRLLSILHSIKHLVVTDKGEYIEFEILDKEFVLFFCNIISKFLHGIYSEKDKF